MAKRKRFTKGFKAKVAIEALKGQRSLQESAKGEYGIHPYLLKEIEIDRPNQHDYETAAEPVVGLRTCFDFYNNERPHQTLRDNTPAEVCKGIVSLTNPTPVYLTFCLGYSMV